MIDHSLGSINTFVFIMPHPTGEIVTFINLYFIGPREEIIFLQVLYVL